MNRRSQQAKPIDRVSRLNSDFIVQVLGAFACLVTLVDWFIHPMGVLPYIVWIFTFGVFVVPEKIGRGIIYIPDKAFAYFISLFFGFLIIEKLAKVKYIRSIGAWLEFGYVVVALYFLITLTYKYRRLVITNSEKIKILAYGSVFGMGILLIYGIGF